MEFLAIDCRKIAFALLDPGRLIVAQTYISIFLHISEVYRKGS